MGRGSDNEEGIGRHSEAGVPDLNDPVIDAVPRPYEDVGVPGSQAGIDDPVEDGQRDLSERWNLFFCHGFSP